jgi:Zn-dependent protease
MGRRLRLGRILGVEVALDWSWIVTFVLAAWTLVSIGARVMPHLGPLPLAMLGAASAVGLFASLLVHEIARGLVARSFGVPVRRVTLFLLGSITDVEGRPASPKSEAAGALAAPFASLALAVLLVLSIAITYGPVPRNAEDIDRLGAPGAVLVWLAAANVAIAMLNLLPAYPLDGGRLLRALLWRTTGDVERATRWSAWAGQVVGWFLVILGLALAFSAHGPGIAGAMWIAFVGWFIASAAAQGYEGLRIQDALTGVTVGRLMRRAFVAIPADVTVSTAMRTFLARSDGRPMPVVDGHAFVGLLSFRDVRDLPADAWRSMLAREAARPPKATVTARTAVSEALPLLGDVESERVPVIETHGPRGEEGETRLVGILDRHDVMRWLEAHARGEAMRRSEVV